MAKKKKILMYEMKCDTCGKDPKRDDNASSESWNVIPMNCECGGRIKIDFTKPYYVENVKNELNKNN